LVDLPRRGTASGKVSGAWVFRGSRVPVSALFANLESSATVDEFLEWFPGISRDQVDGVLEHATVVRLHLPI
jgi:uncharacterized protein (DUF433 family)